MDDSICIDCNHPRQLHNDAGSEPMVGLGGAPDGFIPKGQSCCYGPPNYGEEGLTNWYSKVCGCTNKCGTIYHP